MTARWSAWRASCPRVAPRASRASMANTTETPITNTKVGKTRSVAVRPFQAAWFMKPHEPSPPLLLTMIMNAIVIPRTTSRDSSLRPGSFMVTAVVVIELQASWRSRHYGAVTVGLHASHLGPIATSGTLRAARDPGLP